MQLKTRPTSGGFFISKENTMQPPPSPELYRLLGEMKGKLDAVAARCERMEEKLDAAADSLHARVTRVENAQARHLGMMAGASALLVAAWEIIRAMLDLRVK